MACWPRPNQPPRQSSPPPAAALGPFPIPAAQFASAQQQAAHALLPPPFLPGSLTPWARESASSLPPFLLLPRRDSSREGSSPNRIRAAISLPFSRKPTPINPLGQPRGLLFAFRQPNRALDTLSRRVLDLTEPHTFPNAARAFFRLPA